jgi:pyrroline-5-carboxylate reductase
MALQWLGLEQVYLVKEIKEIDTIGFIGAGNLGKHAMERLAPSHKILAFDPIEDKKMLNLGVKYVDINELVNGSEIIFLTIKPNKVEEIAFDISKLLSSQPVISFVAGLKLNTLKKLLNNYENIHRAMPTLGISSGSSPIAIHSEVDINESSVMSVLNLLGRCLHIDEHQFDAFTSIFGAGPAYISHLSDTLAEIAKEHGFIEPEPWIRDMLDGTSFIHKSNEGSKKFEDIKTMVASKGGVTEAALKKIDSSGLKDIWREAINDAIKKSKSLGD